MASHAFYLPTLSLFGPGCLNEIGNEIASMGHKKALIVTDKSLVQFGYVKKVTDILDKSGIAHALFDGVQPNPTVQLIKDGLAMLNAENCDCIISIGGGSAHDASKTIGCVKTNGGEVEDYLEDDVVINKKAMDLIAINTTAGTASEVTRVAVVTDPVSKRKFAFKTKHILAAIAVNDPELMTSLPKGLTAGTGMDALTHAVESLVAKTGYTLTEELALSAIKLIFKYLPVAVADGSNMEARDAMTYAQYMAGMSFGNANCGIVHGMAHAVGGYYNLPHGLCNAILLPPCMEYNCGSPVAVQKYALMARTVAPERAKGMSDEEAAKLAITMVDELSQTVGTHVHFSELGFKEEDFEEVVEHAMMETWVQDVNPIEQTPEAIRAIYRKVL